MAKTIKFNLNCDDKPVRTIEDLQNNFCIEDILKYYNNQLLHRWLNVRGYKKEYDEVSAIIDKEPIEIIKKLIAIFQVESDEKKVAESIYMLEYLEEDKQLNALYDNGVRQTRKIIDDYEAGYRARVRDIFDNPDDIARIKASLTDMIQNYRYLLRLNYRKLFYVLEKKSKLAVMCLLMKEELREYYLPVSRVENELATELIGTALKNSYTIPKSLDAEADSDKMQMYQRICSMIKKKEFATELGDNLHSFSGKTDGYWKNLEPKGKNYMIISMEQGNYVRSAGVSGGDLGYSDILNKFIITDGIDYESNSDTAVLLYMEV